MTIPLLPADPESRKPLLIRETRKDEHVLPLRSLIATT